MTLLLATLLQAAIASGTIQGNIVNSANEPVSAARVELAGGGQPPVATRTDGQGHFVFANVPQGRYRVSVKKEGYVRQEYGQKSSVGAGTLIVIEPGSPAPSNLVFRLQPAATMALCATRTGSPSPTSSSRRCAEALEFAAIERSPFSQTH